MSLNGLDNPELQQVFDFACAEPGWFFLKYASRDQIELLGKGGSSVREMRELIMKEPDDSPLYGFIRYRRRNILIKLVPDGTSRVLKARSQVHFQSVVERFTPCDVTVAVTSARELTDAALTTACSTHTATASISSSSSSLRQRRLTDIVESAEEGQESKTEDAKSEDKSSSGDKSQGVQVVVTTHDPGVGNDGSRGPIAVEISRPEPIIKIEDEVVTKYADIDDSKTNPSSMSPPRKDSETLRRKSTSSARPSHQDLYSDFGQPKPKVKLGPRPSQDWDRRPHTSATSSKGFALNGENYKPTASVPKNVHIAAPRKSHRNSKSANNSSSQINSSTSGSGGNTITASVTGSSKQSDSLSSNNPVIVVPPTPPLPLQPAGTLTTPTTYSPILLSPTLSISSVRTAKSTSSSQKKQPAITPEKARLMKALELRKKAMSSKAEALAKAEAEEAGQTSGGNKEEIKNNTAYNFNSNPNNNHHQNSTLENSAQPPTIATAIAIAVESNPGTPTSTAAAIPLPSTPSSPNVPDSLKLEVIEAQARVVSIQPSSPIVTDTGSPKLPPDTPDDRENAEAASPEASPIMETGNNASTDELAEPSPAIVDSASADNINNKENAKSSTLEVPKEDDTLFPPKPRSEPSSPMVPDTPDTAEGDAQRHSLRRVGTSPSPLSPSPRSLSPRLPKVNHTRLPSTEVPVIETARSVSAPFMNNASSDNKPVLLSPRKVNVSSGSVSQRIRQLELLTKNKRKPPPPAVTPPKSRPASPSQVLPSLRTSNAKNPSSSTNASASSSTTVTPQKIESPFLQANLSHEDIKSPERSPEFLIPSPSSERVRKYSSPEISPVAFRKDSITEILMPKSPPVENGNPFNEEKKNKVTSFQPYQSRKDSVSSIATSTSSNFPRAEKSTLLIGWVNVQLPDTMLWKRRCLKIDSDGWLCLSVSEDENAPQTRKYNIPKEIRTVVIPDTDEQELPNSVHIMLREGGILQCACENLQEQGEVFRVALSCLSV